MEFDKVWKLYSKQIYALKIGIVNYQRVKNFSRKIFIAGQQDTLDELGIQTKDFGEFQRVSKVYNTCVHCNDFHEEGIACPVLTTSPQ